MNEQSSPFKIPLPDLSKVQRTIHLRLPFFVKILILLVLLILMTPLAMYLTWLFTPSKPLSFLFIDKTSPDSKGIERSSVYWALRHDKYTKRDGRFYLPSIDYQGFVSLHDSQYALTGLEKWNNEAIDSLATHLDAAYFIDTYGVTTAEWTNRPTEPGLSQQIYGGLSREDVALLRALRNQGKPILAEFNFFASPTAASIRQESEELLGIHWTGWTGRYFASLDTLEDPDLPAWIVRRYSQQHGQTWNYHFPGVVLVHMDGTILILEQGGFLVDAMPLIVTNEETADQLGLSEVVPYPFWFDITLPAASNTIVSHFVLQTSAYGDSLLAGYNLRRSFPAVIRSKERPLFYYFALDAADNPAPANFFAYFKRIECLRFFFYNENDIMDRRRFYWEYYLPLLSNVFREINVERSTAGAHR